jgi:endonuclease
MSGSLPAARAAVDSVVLRDQCQGPDAEELADFLDEHLGGGRCLVQVVAECEVTYVGRAASVADAGDFLVMLKADGSLQVHGYKGVKPVNWQPQADRVSVAVEEGQAGRRRPARREPAARAAAGSRSIASSSGHARL